MSAEQESLAVNLRNLERCFAQMMKQYRELESSLADKDLEIQKLKTTVSLQREELRRLGVKLINQKLDESLEKK